MNNPVLVEVTRGQLVESRHRGAIAIVDADGKIVWSTGDIGAEIFPRSAIKALQALPLLETGAADAAGLTPEELALCCSSHNGEKSHVETARSILGKVGLMDTALECGAQPPALEADQATLHRCDCQPGAIHNNCSGKHAGFLTLSSHLNVKPGGYIAADHPVMKEVRQAQADIVDHDLTWEASGTDGCSIPTYAMPLVKLARAFARFGTGNGLEPVRAAAARRLYEACVRHPFMVAGTDRFCTRVMAAFEGRVFVKTGAEGVFTASIPEKGLGVALKCEDGTTRASEVMMAAVIAACLEDSGTIDGFEALKSPELRNRNNRYVGNVRFADEIIL